MESVFMLADNLNIYGRCTCTFFRYYRCCCQIRPPCARCGMNDERSSFRNDASRSSDWNVCRDDSNPTADDSRKTNWAGRNPTTTLISDLLLALLRISGFFTRQNFPHDMGMTHANFRDGWLYLPELFVYWLLRGNFQRELKEWDARATEGTSLEQLYGRW